MMKCYQVLLAICRPVETCGLLMVNAYKTIAPVSFFCFIIGVKFTHEYKRDVYITFVIPETNKQTKHHFAVSKYGSCITIL